MIPFYHNFSNIVYMHSLLGLYIIVLLYLLFLFHIILWLAYIQQLFSF